VAFLLKLERGQRQGPTSGHGADGDQAGRPIGSRGAERWMGLHFCGGAGPEWAFPLYVWLTDNSDLGSGELYLRMTSLLLRQWQSQTRETVEHVRSVRRERRFALPPSLSRQHIPTALIAGARQKRARRVELLCGCNLLLSLRHAAGRLCRRSRGAKRAETSASVRSGRILAAPANSASARAVLWRAGACPPHRSRGCGILLGGAKCAILQRFHRRRDAGCPGVPLRPSSTPSTSISRCLISGG